MEGQIGLENTPKEYVEKLVVIFQEIRRVLKDDGTVWLNIGDSYAGSGKCRGSGGAGEKSGKQKTNTGAYFDPSKQEMIPDGCKPKDLIGIPWRVAFALQADGWYLRQDIIWHKPNPMPESVTDRCTKAHEYIFLITKSRKYYYDIEPIREPIKESCDATIRAIARERSGPVDIGDGAKIQERIYDEIKGANRRSVWTVPTQPFSQAHFATFPETLITPCILAGSNYGDTILDPFMGSGTTALVSKKLNRNAIGLEINPRYIEICKSRLKQNVLPLEII